MVKEESKVRRFYSTAILIFSFVALGMSTAMIGPALPDLAFKTHHSTKDYTSVFMARAFGFLIGVIIGGKVSDKKDEMAVTGLAIGSDTIRGVLALQPISALHFVKM